MEKAPAEGPPETTHVTFYDFYKAIAGETLKAMATAEADE